MKRNKSHPAMIRLPMALADGIRRPDFAALDRKFKRVRDYFFRYFEWHALQLLATSPNCALTAFRSPFPAASASF
jgi:hypothetical protein